MASLNIQKKKKTKSIIKNNQCLQKLINQYTTFFSYGYKPEHLRSKPKHSKQTKINFRQFRRIYVTFFFFLSLQFNFKITLKLFLLFPHKEKCSEKLSVSRLAFVFCFTTLTIMCHLSQSRSSFTGYVHIALTRPSLSCPNSYYTMFTSNSGNIKELR